MKKILFEGTVRDSRRNENTNPPEEILELEYDVPPIEVYEITYNEKTGKMDSRLDHVNTKGLTWIDLPEYKGLKVGDKIQVIKV